VMGASHSAWKELLPVVCEDKRLVILDDSSYEEVVELATTAFVGTDKSAGEGLRWLLGPENRSSPPSSSDKTVDCVRYTVKRFTKTTFLWGCVIGCREDEGTGQLVSAALLFPPGAITDGQVLPWYRQLVLDASLYWEKSPIESNPQRFGPHAVARGKAFISALSSFHAKHASCPHWYVNVLAVHPDHQGKGLGSMLLKTVMGMAQRAQPNSVPVYLECFASKGAYYSKWMEAVEQIEMANPDTSAESDGPLKAFAMVYKPPASAEEDRAEEDK